MLLHVQATSFSFAAIKNSITTLAKVSSRQLEQRDWVALCFCAAPASQQRLQVQPASRDEKIKASIKDAFLQTDKEILGLAERKKFGQSGSTALVAMLHGNPKLGTALRLVLAHTGDSRAVLCRAGEAVALTEDHRPDRIDEKKRVERAGGLVLNVRGAWRIAAPANPKSNAKNARREYQGMSVTRSFGDFNFKQPSPLSVAEPEVKVMTPTDKDLFVVLCTANVYSVCTNQEVVDLAIEHWDDPEAASKHIVRTAFKKGADGNLTAMVIQFGWADKNVKSSLERRRVMAAQAAECGEAPRPLRKVGAAPVLEAIEKDGFDMFG
jgi:protein phosphatase 1L